MAGPWEIIFIDDGSRRWHLEGARADPRGRSERPRGALQAELRPAPRHARRDRPRPRRRGRDDGRRPPERARRHRAARRRRRRRRRGRERPAHRPRRRLGPPAALEARKPDAAQVHEVRRRPTSAARSTPTAATRCSRSPARSASRSSRRRSSSRPARSVAEVDISHRGRNGRSRYSWLGLDPHGAARARGLLAAADPVGGDDHRHHVVASSPSRPGSGGSSTGSPRATSRASSSSRRSCSRSAGSSASSWRSSASTSAGCSATSKGGRSTASPPISRDAAQPSSSGGHSSPSASHTVTSPERTAERNGCERSLDASRIAWSADPGEERRLLVGDGPDARWRPPSPGTRPPRRRRRGRRSSAATSISVPLSGSATMTRGDRDSRPARTIFSGFPERGMAIAVLRLVERLEEHRRVGKEDRRRPASVREPSRPALRERPRSGRDRCADR